MDYKTLRETDETVVILPGARVNGDVTFDRGCSVWFNAVIRGDQAILFLNRRGNSRCLVCVDCGDAPSCPRCSVYLTYHSVTNRLMCHYCGYSEPVTERCPHCGGALRPVGAGTQKVEEELR